MRWPTSPRRWSHPVRRAVLVAALVALVLAQALGALHAIVHAPRLASSGGALPTIERSVETRSDWMVGLFAGHAHGDRGCDLYDQLSHADGLPTALPALPPAPPVAAIEVVHAAVRLASQAAGFLARGPPLRSN